MDNLGRADGQWTCVWDADKHPTPEECWVGGAACLSFACDGLSRLVAEWGRHYYHDETGAWISLENFGSAHDDWNVVMSVQLSRFTGADLGRVASYVWGPDIGSERYSFSSWQRAGGVGGLLMVFDGASTALYGRSSRFPSGDDYFPRYDRLGNIIEVPGRKNSRTHGRLRRTPCVCVVQMGLRFGLLELILMARLGFATMPNERCRMLAGKRLGEYACPKPNAGKWMN